MIFLLDYYKIITIANLLCCYKTIIITVISLVGHPLLHIGLPYRLPVDSGLLLLLVYSGLRWTSRFLRPQGNLFSVQYYQLIATSMNLFGYVSGRRLFTYLLISHLIPWTSSDVASPWFDE